MNTARKIALNLIRIYKETNCKKNTPLTSVMKANLFDAEVLGEFLEFFGDWEFVELD